MVTSEEHSGRGRASSQVRKSAEKRTSGTNSDADRPKEDTFCSVCCILWASTRQDFLQYMHADEVRWSARRGKKVWDKKIRAAESTSTAVLWKPASFLPSVIFRGGHRHCGGKRLKWHNGTAGLPREPVELTVDRSKEP